MFNEPRGKPEPNKPGSPAYIFDHASKLASDFEAKLAEMKAQRQLMIAKLRTAMVDNDALLRLVIVSERYSRLYHGDDEPHFTEKQVARLRVQVAEAQQERP